MRPNRSLKLGKECDRIMRDQVIGYCLRVKGTAKRISGTIVAAPPLGFSR